jgi:hypothetical protein
MNSIKSQKWSLEWYEDAAPEELVAALDEVKRQIINTARKDPKNHRRWQGRYERLQEEMRSRESEIEDSELV